MNQDEANAALEVLRVWTELKYGANGAVEEAYVMAELDCKMNNLADLFPQFNLSARVIDES